MFAKLKKKIQEEAGSVTNSPTAEGVKSPASQASPMGKGDHAVTPLASPEKWDADTPSVHSPVSRTSSQSTIGDETPRTSGSGTKEEVLALLMKRTEQVKKLEGKISDLAVMLKEKNRNIDKLEQSLEKQKELTDLQLRESSEKHKANCAKMAEGFNLALERKEHEVKENMKKNIEELEQSQAELADRLAWAERSFNEQEDKEEMKDLTVQELAKVKHMLLNAQEDKSECERRLEASNHRAKDLEAEVGGLLQQITGLTCSSEETERTNRHLEVSLADLQRDHDILRTQKHEMDKKIAQKTSEMNHLQMTYTAIENELQSLRRNSELHKSKTSQLIEEKDDEIDRLKERVTTLDQRLQHGHLSGDERVEALQVERDSLERRLAETREQLGQVKISWSDRISQLEQQIANLSAKMAEDAQDKKQAQAAASATQRQLEEKVEAVQLRAEAAEQEVKTKEALLQGKENLLMQQKQLLEEEKLKSLKGEQVWLQKVADLEAKLKDLEREMMLERTSSRSKISALEAQQEDWLEKEIDAENKLSALEGSLQKFKADATHKDKGSDLLKKQLQDSHRDVEQLQAQLTIIQEDSMSQGQRTAELRQTLKSLQTNYQLCSKEKDELMLRNAQLFQEFEAYKRRASESRGDAERDFVQKDNAIAGLETALKELQEELAQSRDQVEQLKTRDNSCQVEAASEETSRVTAQLKELETQLAEKNRTIKMQQQRLGDLKKTLQRELKVQALPNDEPSGGITPSSSTRDLRSLGTSVAEAVSTATKTLTSAEPPTLVLSSNANNSHVENGSRGPNSAKVSSFTDLGSALNSDFVGYGSSHSGDPYGHHQSKHYHQPHHPYSSGSSSSHRASRLPYSDEEFDLRKDLNFEYLKHVVLKFMLSREAEALQLIKAVAMLLHFSAEEQQLIRDSLEGRNSWFGSRPSLSQIHVSRFVPPS